MTCVAATQSRIAIAEIVTATTLFTTCGARARKVLQQRRFVGGAFFAGAECIGHAPAFESGPAAGLLNPSAQ